MSINFQCTALYQIDSINARLKSFWGTVIWLFHRQTFSSIVQVNQSIQFLFLQLHMIFSMKKLLFISLILIHNFQFNMLFVAFYLLVFGALVDQNLGCKSTTCVTGKWVTKTIAGRRYRFCVTDRDVSN